MVDGKHDLILQANKNAANPGVKAAASEDSHKIWAKILVDPENPNDDKDSLYRGNVITRM